MVSNYLFCFTSRDWTLGDPPRPIFYIVDAINKLHNKQRALMIMNILRPGEQNYLTTNQLFVEGKNTWWLRVISELLGYTQSL